ncbi:MAG: DUF4272 domain-containing protein [Erysipelotrichaceae bacterium]|nr:DUF4272 domain-containing protein [Erysipelotrichaceae bacterium]
MIYSKEKREEIRQLAEKWEELGDKVSEEDIFYTELAKSIVSPSVSILKETINEEEVDFSVVSLVMQMKSFQKADVVSDEQWELSDILNFVLHMYCLRNERLFNDFAEKLVDAAENLHGEEQHAVNENKEKETGMTEEERIQAIKDKLKARGLHCPENLGINDEVELRSVREIAVRAVVTTIMSHLAFYMFDEDYRERYLNDHESELRKFKVYDDLFEEEKKILNEDYSECRCNQMSWQYQAAITLLWILGLVDSIDDASEPKEVQDEIDDLYLMVTKYESIDSLIEKCRLRDKEELADICELYWHYHWSIRDAARLNYYKLTEEERKRILNTVSSDVVPERRKALEWAVYSEEDDNGEWDFPLDT